MCGGAGSATGMSACERVKGTLFVLADSRSLAGPGPRNKKSGLSTGNVFEISVPANPVSHLHRTPRTQPTMQVPCSHVSWTVPCPNSVKRDPFMHMSYMC